MSSEGIEVFRTGVEAIALDPDGVHHEFVGGYHGQKLDFDLIDETDPLYEIGIDLAADRIARHAATEKLVLVGVANGANRIAQSISSVINIRNVIVLETEKINDRVRYTKRSLQFLAREAIGSLVIVDDIGKSGESIAQVALQSWDNGTISDMSAFVLWQRRQQMVHLESLKIPYDTLVKQPLPDFTKHECETTGFCKQGWALIEK